ncbi:hypothetical protein G8764_15230 [Pseudomaricurvus alcaniphilus]|nr:hypothetical protein [Pseudomaricurvus alcaniphilus]
MDTVTGRRRVLAVGLLCAGLVLLVIWSLRQPVPPPEVVEPLPDFKQFEDVQAMKAAFFEYLQPMVERQNAVIAAQRQRLQELAASYADDKQMSSSEAQALQELSEQYRVDTDLSPARQLEALLLRVDTIPLELALVQAAKESGWGRSRFALTGNNLFGQWCYEPGCGVVPAKRKKGAKHELKSFATVEDAIADYLLNLNSHPRYKPMRAIRAKLRQQNAAVNGLALADGLLHYSERRHAYVTELKSMIRQYRRFALSLQAAQEH